MASILIFIILLYGFILGFFYIFQSSFLFFPQPLTTQTNHHSQNIEEVDITTANNLNLHGWLCKSQPDDNQKLIIYFGGNAEEVSHLIPINDKFDDWSVLLINYPGYGKSEGKPGQKNFFLAAEAIYNYAVSEKGFHPHNIVLMGRSIGTGSAAYLAHKKQVGALVLISPFESIRAVAQSKMPFLPIGLILKHPFNSQKYALEISYPMLALHGTDDNIIPIQHGQRLTKKWNGPSKLIQIKNYGHNDLFESDLLWEEIRSFLNEVNQ